MAEGVKGKRRYNSPHRREQAAATRREILDSALRLFEEQGYAATTMAAIATEAGVALEDRVRRVRDEERRSACAVAPLLRGDQDDVPMRTGAGTESCSRSPTPSVSSA